MEKVKYIDGIYDISNAQYHASEGISRSMLMEFKRSPYHYWYKYVSGLAEKEEPTPAMNLGNAVHTLVLEPSKLENEFRIIPNLDRRTKVGKELYEAFLIESSGKTILTNDQFEQALAMATSVIKNPNSANLFKDCLVEKSIYFTHKPTGLQVKARPDAWSGSIVMDLKTTAEASLRAFQSSSVKYGYFLQAAIVNEALASIDQFMEHFVFVPVEKSAPHCVAVYMVDGESITESVREFDILMAGLATCLETNVWPGYGIKDLTMPKWGVFQDELEVE